MGEQHTLYTNTLNANELLYNVVRFIRDSGQDAIRFVDGGGGQDAIYKRQATITSSSVASPTVITTSGAHGLTTGQTVAIEGHTGSTPSINGVHTCTVTGSNTFTIPVNVTVGGTGGTVGRLLDAAEVTSSSDTGTDCYIVFEPVDEYPRGGRWQCRIRNDGGDDLYVWTALEEGWTNAAQDFGSSYTMPAAGEIAWTTTIGTDVLYCSASNLDTYDSGSANYSYLRIMRHGTGGPTDSFYVGGYEPHSPADDDAPVCMLQGGAWAYAAVAAWGYAQAGNTDAYVAGNYAHTTGGVNGYIGAVVKLNGRGKDYNGVYTCPRVTMFSGNPRSSLGTFGPYTMYAVDSGRADLDTDDTGSYLVWNDLFLRWVP